MNQNSLSNDIQDAKKSFKGFFRSIFGESSQFDKLAYFKNPESMLDEILIGLWGLILIASLFTIYYGFRYHLSIFENTGNAEWEAFAIAISVFFSGELIKVFLGHRFMRSLFSGFFAKGLPQLVLVVLMGVLSYYAFKWSITISSQGYGMVTANKAKKDVLSKTGDYTALTAPFDAQIADAQKTIESGRKVTWAGKVTWEGQQIIKAATKTLNQLNTDRQKAIEMAQKKDGDIVALSGAKIDESEQRQNDYGTKAEYVVIFSLLMLGLIEVISYRQNKDIIDAATPKDSQNNFFKMQKNIALNTTIQPQNSEARPNIGGAAERRMISFRKETTATVVVAPPTPSVVEKNKVGTTVEPEEIEESQQAVYTTYIRGYVKVGESEWRNPTQFIGLLRNAYNRGYTQKIELRREQLAAHLDDKHITAEIIKFCKTNRDIMGAAVWAKFKTVMGEEVTNG